MSASAHPPKRRVTLESISVTDQSPPVVAAEKRKDSAAADEKNVVEKRRRLCREIENAPSLLPTVIVDDATDDEYQDVARRLCTLGDGSLAIRTSGIPNAGLGLFALRNFAKHEPITAYVGLLISHADALELRAQQQDTHVRRHIAMRWAIDGCRLPESGVQICDPQTQMRGLGVAAFANHCAAGAAECNAKFDFVDSATNKRKLQEFFDGKRSQLEPCERVTFLRATRPIEVGEEILVSYGKQYWQSVSPPAKKE